MAELQMNLEKLPANTRTAFRELGQLLTRFARDDLLALSAFGGWLVNDPLHHGTPARSVAVLRHLDLRMLDQLAPEGVRLGKLGLGAPLMMTPEYIQASCDTFPLELLEIQHQHIPLGGEDHFAALRFEHANLRLQCEHELKSELIHLRQGLLSAAGSHKHLGALCRHEAERATRVLRGMLHLAGRELPPLAAELVAQAADATGLKLDGLRSVVADARHVDFAAFQRFYEDLAALADYVDQLDRPAG
jgi:hypothetical protein